MRSSTPKILLVRGSRAEERLLAGAGFSFTHDPAQLFAGHGRVNLVVFTGGEDVSPELYGRTPHPSTHINLDRDIAECDIFDEAVEAGIPFLGICRGAQFLCAMAGGTLVQDISGHLGDHPVTCTVPEFPGTCLVTSTHHQMQNPFGLPPEEYTVLVHTPAPRSTHYALDRDTTILAERASAELRSEPDVVWYPRCKALAVQFHPEWMDDTSAGYKLFQRLFARYLLPHLHEENDPHREEAHSSAC